MSNCVLNPKTGRYVLKEGKLGKQILSNPQCNFCEFVYDVFDNKHPKILYIKDENLQIPRDGKILDETDDKEMLLKESDIRNRYLHKIKFKHSLKKIQVVNRTIHGYDYLFWIKEYPNQEFPQIDVFENIISNLTENENWRLFVHDKVKEWLKKEDKRYSGYEIVGGESPTIRLINSEDIVSDEVIFDYLQEPLEADVEKTESYIKENGYVKLTEDEKLLLKQYINSFSLGRNMKKFTSKLLKRFTVSPVVSDFPEYTLYRGLSWDEKSDFSKYCQKGSIEYSNISSWTSNICVATSIASSGNYGVVHKITVKREDILVDTRIIDRKQLREIYVQVQQEVILKPGNYPCDIIFINEDFELLYPNKTPIPIIKLN